MTGDNMVYQRDIRREFWPANGSMRDSKFGSLDATECMPSGSTVRLEGRYYQGPVPKMTHRESMQ